jgi:predicted nucleic acid-binding protein
LAELRVRTGLKLPDCCVLDVALQHRAAVATFDDRLARVARDLGLDVVGAESAGGA